MNRQELHRRRRQVALRSGSFIISVSLVAFVAANVIWFVRRDMQFSACQSIVAKGGVAKVEAAPKWSFSRFDIQSVVRVDLVDPGVTRRCLPELTRIPRLRSLRIVGMPFSDEHLLELQAVKDLRWLELDSVPVSKDALNAFQDALPKCIVHVSEAWLVREMVRLDPYAGLGAPRPLSLLGITNCLRALGRERALRALQAFERTTRRTENYNSHLFVPLVFMPTDPERCGFPDGTMFAVEIQGGIPFDTQIPQKRGGLPPTIGAKLTLWAKKHGKIRDSLLVPVPNPMDAADCLYAKMQERFDCAELPAFRYALREQACIMIRDIDPAFMDRTGPLALSDEFYWRKLKTHVSTLRIRWNERDQRYERNSR